MIPPRPLRASTFRLEETPRDLLEAWRGLCAAHPAFASPLLGPDFALAVAACREDARVTALECGGEPVGFLAYHVRPGGFARPIGSPFSDLHALVSAETAGLGIGEALRAAGLSAYRVQGLVDPFGTFARAEDFALHGQRDAYDIHLDATPEDYLEAIRADSPKRFKNMRRLEHKLEREVGPLRVAADLDESAFDRTLAWKRDQFLRTGAHDVLRPDWTRALMTQLFHRREGDFRGLMLSLYAGDTHIASHFGVRMGDRFHPWLASANPEYAVYSPGQTFLMQAISAMPAHRLATYALGHGHDHYKRPFVREPYQVAEGLAAAASGAGAMARLRERTWALPGIGGIAAVGQLKRRLDHIASVELSAVGRARGVMDAFAARVMRSAGKLVLVGGVVDLVANGMALA